MLGIIIISLCIKFCTPDPINPSKSQTNKVLEFSLSDYWGIVADFPYEGNVGEVATPEVAIEKAKILWKERYRDLYMEDNCPIVVAYDVENACWRVNGTLEDLEGYEVVGAVPQALIKTNGQVLALWYG